MERTPKLITALNAVTATTTSGAVDVLGAEKITLLFTRADHVAGSTVFSVTGSVDGTTYVTLNNLIDNVVNSNAQTFTRVASSSLASDTSKIYTIDLDGMGLSLHSIKVTATETTDGTHTAKVLVEY